MWSVLVPAISQPHTHTHTQVCSDMPHESEWVACWQVSATLCRQGLSLSLPVYVGGGASGEPVPRVCDPSL